MDTKVRVCGIWADSFGNAGIQFAWGSGAFDIRTIGAAGRLPRLDSSKRIPDDIVQAAIRIAKYREG